MKTIPDYVHDHFARYSTHKVRPQLVCADGMELSVQASHFHYCNPRRDREEHYSHVEVMTDRSYPSLGRKDTSRGIYPFVPVADVNRLIHKHGGVR